MDYDEEDYLCSICNGSGEGRTDMSRCYCCKGSGVSNPTVNDDREFDWRDDYEYQKF